MRHVRALLDKEKKPVVEGQAELAAGPTPRLAIF